MDIKAAIIVTSIDAFGRKYRLVTRIEVGPFAPPMIEVEVSIAF